MCVVAVHLLTLGTVRKLPVPTRAELGLGNSSGNLVLAKLEDIRTLFAVLVFAKADVIGNGQQSLGPHMYVAMLFSHLSSGLACAIFIV
jgi:hypothetical protein